MKNIFRKIKENILVSDLIFIFVNIILNFILYLLNIRFRIWVIILIVCISALGFIIGIIKEIYKTFDNKKQNIILTILSIISILLLLLVFLPIIGLTFIFKYMPEHTVTLNDKKYVAVVRSFLHIDVDYYNYELNRKVPFIIWTKDSKGSKTLNKKISKVMGMYDAMPTLANMLGFKYKYALGHDIFNTDNNIVVFPNGNWVTDKMYYNAQKEEYLLLKDSIVNDDEIEKNKSYANKLLEVSDAIIVYDLEAENKNEKN